MAEWTEAERSPATWLEKAAGVGLFDSEYFDPEIFDHLAPWRDHTPPDTIWTPQ